MQQLTYRSIEERDYKEIEALLEQTGYFETFTPNEKVRKLVLEIYLRSCLEEQTYTKVVETQGKVIGILCGRSDADYKRSVWTPYTCGLLGRLLKLHLTKEGSATIKAYRDFSKIYKELIQGREEDFDGELTLLLVDENYRGTGIGKQLTQRFLNHMKKAGGQSIYVYTDTGCNYGFYDRLGFVKAAKREEKIEVEKGNRDMSVYLYYKKFK